MNLESSSENSYNNADSFSIAFDAACEKCNLENNYLLNQIENLKRELDNLEDFTHRGRMWRQNILNTNSGVQDYRFHRGDEWGGYTGKNWPQDIEPEYARRQEEELDQFMKQQKMS